MYSILDIYTGITNLVIIYTRKPLNLPIFKTEHVYLNGINFE